MIDRRLFLLGAAAASAALPLGPAIAQNNTRHWLIGDWVGAREARSQSDRYGADRVLSVTSVAADGKSAKAILTSTGKVGVNLVVDGERVRFTTTTGTVSGSDYDLKRSGDTLTGSYTNTIGGRPGAITLTKRQ